MRNKRQIINIDDLNLDQDDYKKYNGRRFVIGRGKVVVVMSGQDYNLDNLLMDELFTKFIHKDGDEFNFSKENIIKKPKKKPKVKPIRICPDCGVAELRPKCSYCPDCAINRRYKR